MECTLTTESEIPQFSKFGENDLKVKVVPWRNRCGNVSFRQGRQHRYPSCSFRSSAVDRLPRPRPPQHGARQRAKGLTNQDFIYTAHFRWPGYSAMILDKARKFPS